MIVGKWISKTSKGLNYSNLSAIKNTREFIVSSFLLSMKLFLSKKPRIRKGYCEIYKKLMAAI
jgi:hypothetical protein